jgi:hypothetical protein
MMTHKRRNSRNDFVTRMFRRIFHCVAGMAESLKVMLQCQSIILRRKDPVDLLREKVLGVREHVVESSRITESDMIPAVP